MGKEKRRNKGSTGRDGKIENVRESKESGIQTGTNGEEWENV